MDTIIRTYNLNVGLHQSWNGGAPLEEREGIGEKDTEEIR
jgi:hypothetical protein